MNIELTEGEARHASVAIKAELARLIRVPEYAISREIVQEHVKRFDTASALAKIDPKQFGPREIQKGDPVKTSGGESAVVLSRGRGEFDHRVAIETTDGDVRLAYASQLKVIA